MVMPSIFPDSSGGGGFLDPEAFRREIFGQHPELAFLGRLGQAGLPRGANRFLRGRQGDFLQRFLQSQGQQLLGGGLPTQTAQDFFSGLDFRNELSRFSPQARGQGIRQFAPPVRFLNF